MPDSFDIIVIGTGPAASRIARRCASERSVAVVEAREPGGTCALRGCNPKKVLARAAELIQWCGSMPYAPQGLEAQFSWKDLSDFKRGFVATVPENTRESLADQGIALFETPARFAGPQAIAVGDRTIHAEQLVIATGARPRPVDLPGAEFLCTSDDFLELTELPDRIVFVGGGYVSFEFAHIAARFGATCQIIDRGPTVLDKFDASLVAKLVGYTRELGVKIHTDATLERIERNGEGAYNVCVSDKSGAERVLETDLVVHGAGRIRNLDGLDLANGNIESNDRGVAVNAHLQSVSNPHVYAAGDVADNGQPMLSPVASQDGRIVAKNLLEGPVHTPDYGIVPTVVYTVPGLAAAGLTEAQAREQNLDFSIKEGDRADWLSMRKVGAPCAGYRILVENKTGRILGAHLLGPDAAETINHFAVAMKFNLTANDLKSVLFAFPSFSADVRQML